MRPFIVGMLIAVGFPALCAFAIYNLAGTIEHTGNHFEATPLQLETARAGLTRAFITVRCGLPVSITLWYPAGDSVTVTEHSPPQAIAGVNRIVAAIPGSNVRYFNAGCPDEQ